jgi:hypothetical protein
MSQSHYIALALVGLSVAAYLRNKNKKTPYSDSGDYKNMTPMKHDLIKDTVIQMFPLLIYAITSKEFFSKTNFLDSFVGRQLMTLSAYFIFYQLIEPYVANRIEKF